MQFNDILTKVRGDNFTPPLDLLCIDPGHTTGWCKFADGKLSEWGQAITVKNRKGNNEGDIDWYEVEQMLHPSLGEKPDCVVCEDYRVYQHKLERHANSQVLTLRIIGAIEYWCWVNDVPIYYQMASVAKGFTTDKKLRDWDMWKDGMRHSRDAIRHGCYALLFNKEIGGK